MKAFILAAMLAVAPFPFQTFSESVGSTVGAKMGVCMTPTGPKEVFSAVVAHGVELYAFWVEPESGKILFAHYPSRDAEMPDAIAKATVDKSQHDKVPPHTFVPLPNDGQGPCEHLFEKQT